MSHNAAARVNPYTNFIRSIGSVMVWGRGYSLGQTLTPRDIKSNPAKKALILSPHPDDEVITGLWPYRLSSECGWEIVNVAVTLGSDRARRAQRLRELKNCCAYIGFRIVQTAPEGLEHVHLGSIDSVNEKNICRIAEIIDKEKPRVIFMPHSDDMHPAHIGTHMLGMEALKLLGKSITVVFTEYWHPMRDPNVMLEGSPEDVAEIVAALSLHKKEVERNPYHVSLPFWMVDNVRRGSEVVGERGAVAPKMQYAVLYRLHKFDGQMLGSKHFIPSNQSPETVLL